MKIAVWHNVPSGGSKRALYYHLKGLKERGHTIEIWTTPQADSEYLDFSSLGPIHVVPLPPPQQVVPFKDRFGYFVFRQDSYMRQMQIHSALCAEQMQAGGFDVLFANSCMVYAAPYIGRFIKIPSLLYLAEPSRHLYEANPILPWMAPDAMHSWTSLSYWRMLINDFWRERRFRVLVREERTNLLAFRKVLVNSLFSVETCLRVYGKSTEVGYLGVDTSIFKHLNLPRQKFVICTGSFQARKDPAFIIESLQQVKASKRPALVWVANYTDAAFEAQMRALAKQSGVELILRKMVSDEELVSLLNQASAFVYAAQLEPFGLAPLEASACGLPVVAVAEGGIRETVVHQQNGLLVSRSTRQMGRAIERLLDDEPLWQQLSTQALELIENQWSMRHCIDRIETALYDTAMLVKQPTVE
ncbi:glycosyltransferase family 4 protein [Spirosoma soli]|uniref:Glycosyltransferase family 4 protein n=1 Tax=Spirosoma soli TaxID=1770529 RepID=A0ABW5LXD8_9BACT